MQTAQLDFNREQREQVISYLPASEKAELRELARREYQTARRSVGA